MSVYEVTEKRGPKTPISPVFGPRLSSIFVNQSSRVLALRSREGKVAGEWLALGSKSWFPVWFPFWSHVCAALVIFSVCVSSSRAGLI